MIPRIRSVDDVVKYIRKNDPESDVTEYVLKTLCERSFQLVVFDVERPFPVAISRHNVVMHRLYKIACQSCERFRAPPFAPPGPLTLL